MDKDALAKLIPQAKWLLAMHTVFLIGLSLSNIFFNVFLWKFYGNINLAAAFNFIYFLTVPFAFFLGSSSIMQKRLGCLGSLQVSLFIHAIFYFLVLVLGQRVADWYILLGIVMGIGQGFYYLGYNVLTYDWTNNENRNSFSGLNGALSSLAFMIAPLAGGVLISTLGTIPGYRLVFALALVSFLIAGVISLRFKSDDTRCTALFSKALKVMDRNWIRVCGGMVLRGVREGVMSFALILLVYEITRNEANLGFYNLVTSFVTMVSYYAVGKYVSQDKRFSSMLWGALVLTVITCVLLSQDMYGLWLFGIANSIFYPFIYVPLTTITYNTIRDNSQMEPYRLEFLTIREVPLSLGRLIGIALLLLFVWKNLSVYWIIWGLGISQIPIALILKPVKA